MSLLSKLLIIFVFWSKSMTKDSKNVIMYKKIKRYDKNMNDMIWYDIILIQ